MTGKFNFCKSHSNSFYTLLNMLAMWIHVNRSHSSPMERVLQKSKILVTFLVLPKILNSSHFQFKVTGKIKILVTFLVLPKILNWVIPSSKWLGKSISASLVQIYVFYLEIMLSLPIHFIPIKLTWIENPSHFSSITQIVHMPSHFQFKVTWTNQNSNFHISSFWITNS